jgi:hypothetical protein
VSAEMLCDHTAECFTVTRMLQYPRTLEILVAVQAGGQQKVPFQQRTGL